MASLIDIRRRIKSVKNTQQITKAMKMVAAARLRRSQDRVIAARPYARTLAETLSSVVAHLAPAPGSENPIHPLLVRREEKNVLVVVVTGDRGLCGAFNTNVNRASFALVRDLKEKGHAVRIVCLGRKGMEFWKRRGAEIVDARPGIFSAFGYETAAGIARDLAARFTSGDADAVTFVYNEFKSVIAQIVRTKRLLPVELQAAPAPAGAEKKAEDAGTSGTVDFLFEPGPEVILSRLLPRHLEFQVYQVLLESAAAENAARMTAMDGASKNAGDMIDSLTLTYNRARQARITKELIEIVSGAAALG
jgi:F-type H+-transporting ATPase subunit gamma